MHSIHVEGVRDLVYECNVLSTKHVGEVEERDIEIHVLYFRRGMQLRTKCGLSWGARLA